MDSGVILSQARLALLGEICLIASSHEDNFEVFPTEGNKRQITFHLAWFIIIGCLYTFLPGHDIFILFPNFF